MKVDAEGKVPSVLPTKKNPYAVHSSVSVYMFYFYCHEYKFGELNLLFDKPRLTVLVGTNYRQLLLSNLLVRWFIIVGRAWASYCSTLLWAHSRIVCLLNLVDVKSHVVTFLQPRQLLWLHMDRLSFTMKSWADLWRSWVPFLCAALTWSNLNLAPYGLRAACCWWSVRLPRLTCHPCFNLNRLRSG